MVRMSGSISAITPAGVEMTLTPESMVFGSYVEAIEALREWAATGFDPVKCEVTALQITITKEPRHD